MLGRTILRFWDRVLDRMPVVRNIYKTLKQIFETAVAPGGFAFHTVGLIEFPRPGLWSLVFVARDLSRDGEIVQKTSGEDMVAVFVPTTPNPTSGYLCYVRKTELILLDMSIEDGIKATVSAGLVGADPIRPGAGTAALAAQPAARSRTASSRSKR